MENAVVVHECSGNVVLDDDFGEKIFRQPERVQLGIGLLLCIHLPGGLNIQTFVPAIHDKVDFLLGFSAIAPVNDDAHIDRAAPGNQFIINNVFSEHFI